MNEEQEIKFLEMVRDLRSPFFFREEFDFSISEVEKHKKRLGAETPDEARALLKTLSRQQDEPKVDQDVVAERERAEQANLRLQEQQRKPKKKAKKPNVSNIKRQDAARQRRFDKQQNKQTAKVLRQKIKERTVWQLPDTETVERFQNDIVNRGFQFCLDKYGVHSNAEIVAEAKRLKLKIDWDLVHK
jgi:exonuclease VII large subunit